MAINKALIEEFANHSCKYQNRRDVLATITIKLDTLDWIMKRINQNIHKIQVSFDNCSSPHLINDCHLDENGNKNAQVCYPRGDKYDYE